MKWEKNAHIIKSVIIAAILFLIDAMLLNTNYIALATLLIVLPALLVKAALARKDRPRLKQILAAAGIYALMALSIISMNKLNNRIAVHRTKTLAAACERYRSKYGAYPNRLVDLSPEFMPAVPAAKIGLAPEPFRYIASRNRHTLLYVEAPPFGIRMYNLEEKKWRQLD